MPEALQCAVERGEKGQAAIEGKRSGRKELFFIQKKGDRPLFSGIVPLLKKKEPVPLFLTTLIKRFFNFHLKDNRILSFLSRSSRFSLEACIDFIPEM
jgi:hypothetical protein